MKLYSGEMSGVVFIITIPTEEHEKILIDKTKRKVIINESEVNKSVPSSSKCFVSETHSGSSQEALVSDCAVSAKNGIKIKPSSSSSSLRVNQEVIEEKNESVVFGISMCKILEDVLTNLGITNFTWTICPNNRYIQVVFPLESNNGYEEVLEYLKSRKIGILFKSVISVVPCSVYCSSSGNEKGKHDPSLEDDSPEKEEHTTAWNRFVSSVRSRLAVAQVVENVKSNATLNFDFIALLMIATVLCAIGLVENSNVYLLSSMLISPMMGPVMAGTFGTVIRDTRLQKMGVQNELIGLGIATVVGFFYGVIISMCTDKYGDNDWPTYEMTSRGEIRALWVGSLIALLSGAAIALGILSDNTASLVGVAISASLMPPAVNAGLLWSIASVYYLKGTEKTRYASLSRTSFYSDTNRSLELAALGGVSLCLTFVNIVCIYLAGILVFKIKEVAPITSNDQAGKQFWRYDIKIARDYNKTLQSDEARNVHRQFTRELKDYHKHGIYNPHRFNLHFENDFLHHSADLSKDTVKVNVKRSQFTWSPHSYLSRCKKFSDIESPGSHKSDRSQLSEAGNKKKLSQIFSPIPSSSNYNRQSGTLQGAISERGSSSLTEKCEGASAGGYNVYNGNKKFTVTPCLSDPLKNKQMQ